MSIYLDHAANTPITALALAALNRAMLEVGNASSSHSQGRLVRREVEEGREAIARIIGCDPTEIVFCGSGTEADNLAIKGLFWASKAKKTIVISSIEHHAVLDSAEWLEEHEGAKIIKAPVTRDGVIDLAALKHIVDSNRGDIALIAVMHSNNEIGTVQPIKKVVEIAGNIPVHTDAVQSIGKVEFNFDELGVTTAAISAHKMGGPLGVAALILKHGLDITPILHGGGQEREIRSSTLNAPGIISFSTAIQEAESHRIERYAAISHLRKSLIEGILRAVPGAHVNGDVEPRLPGIANISFPGAHSESLLVLLDQVGINASQGSACSAGVLRPSHVIEALGSEDAEGTIRFSLGATTTQGDIDRVVEVIADIVEKSRLAR